MATASRLKLELDRASTERFIGYYHSHDCLWNVSSPYYMKRDHRQAVYTSIAQLMGDCMTADQVPAKISALRTYYAKELRKVNQSRKSGAGASDLYVSPWEWYHLLDPFLHSHIQQKATITNMDLSATPSITASPSDETDTSRPTDTSVITSEDNPGVRAPLCADSQESVVATLPEVAPPKKRRQSQDTVQNQVLQTLKSIESRKSQSENCGELYFAKYIASEIASISDIRKRKELKIKIQQLIFDYQDES